MKRIELQLIPAPGQKPEFLATIELVQKQQIPAKWETLPAVIVLEGYTRDGWASDTITTQWITWQVESVDGRKKLPGFIKFLRERQKSCYGRVGNDHIWVISCKQMSSSTVNCRMASLVNIPQCPLKPKTETTSSGNTGTPTSQQGTSSSKPQTKPGLTAATTTTTKATTKSNGTSTGANATKPKRSGLLGNLVGAQNRTNTQMEIAATVNPKNKHKSIPPTTAHDDQETSSDQDGTTTMTDNPIGSTTTTMSTTGTKTAGQVLAEFREEMEQKMLDFDLSTDPCMKIKIDLVGKLRSMIEEEQQTGKVTMEILKYIIYEQAEEVNEEWIAYREPSEFMDEVVIAIYKEGEAPPDVIEDMNKGELPDEVRGQQRAIQEQMQKAEQLKAQKIRMEQTRLALLMKQKQQQETEADDDDGDDDFAALNTQKRDRRTIEDYEREAKRRRGED